jgi:hypothetical protein
LLSASEAACETSDLVQVGQIEISKDATLADLKQQVLLLPVMADLAVQSNRCLRVRLMEGTCPAVVLRLEQMTLR